ncbi:Panacea domain-containing protein [Rhizobium sp. 32-5/1]|uniref:Panacea domain-containing protein n=1 Tax=Rhizobium sp. 32-5/1 TaxID=3019602 RepID=UPI00240E73BC|nr:Panacea domain-containing protein [Rhizobium sp. 32-5/1]WEZ84623.1 Panacea domain-containing protein [Rhizobium sp. 32-5/1]
MAISTYWCVNNQNRSADSTHHAINLFFNETQAYMKSMRFSVDKEKTIEALLYIVSRYGEVGRFHALKTLYYADLDHLRTFGRPITGDRYIAMENGPVPSYAYNAVKEELPEPEREVVVGALSHGDSEKHPTYKAHRSPDLSYFSKTDLECLDRAFEYCRGRSFGQISDETHEHLAWKKAALNAPMRFEDMLDGVSPEIFEEAEQFASYGVL